MQLPVFWHVTYVLFGLPTEKSHTSAGVRRVHGAICCCAIAVHFKGGLHVPTITWLPGVNPLPMKTQAAKRPIREIAVAFVINLPFAFMNKYRSVMAFVRGQVSGRSQYIQDTCVSSSLAVIPGHCAREIRIHEALSVA